MIRRILSLSLCAIILSATFSIFLSSSIHAANDYNKTICDSIDKSTPEGEESWIAAGCNQDEEPIESFIANLLNGVYFVIGVLAVGYIIYGGVRYTMSAGDASKVATAKNTIMYAIIGLIVSLLAFAITNFVISRL